MPWLRKKMASGRNFHEFHMFKAQFHFNQKTGKLLLIAIEEESQQVNDLG